MLTTTDIFVLVKFGLILLMYLTPFFVASHHDYQSENNPTFVLYTLQSPFNPDLSQIDHFIAHHVYRSTICMCNY